MARLLPPLVAVSALVLLGAAPRPAAAEPSCRTVVGRSSTFTWCENRRTRASVAERARLALARPPVLSDAAPAAPSRPRPGPPGGSPSDSYFSWHDLDGSDWMTGVRDQGSCGACFVFGSLAAVESQYKWLAGDPLLEVDLSEQNVISCITAGSCENGGTAQEVGMQLKSEGVTDEACYPYVAQNGDCGSLCDDAAARTSYVTDWHMSTIPWTNEEMKEQLVYGPYPVSMQVYSDFYGYDSGVYSRSESAQAEGWHVVALVGWDDSDQSWIAKNSWAEDFGQGGYFKISMDADCTYWTPWSLEGACFAANVTYFDVEPTDLPGLLCSSTREVELTAEQGYGANVTIDVHNCGQQTVSLSGETAPAAPWLGWTPAQGTLAVGEQTSVDLAANATGLEPGVHETVLRLHGGAGIVLARVVFTVTAPPQPPEGGSGGTPNTGGSPGTGGSTVPPVTPAPSASGGDEEEGCGCRLPARRSSGTASLATLLAGIAALARRRRRPIEPRLPSAARAPASGRRPS